MEYVTNLDICDLTLQQMTAIVRTQLRGLSTRVFQLNFCLNLVCDGNGAQSSLALSCSPFLRAVIHQCQQV